jgi:WD40 repeat protein
VTGSDFTGFSWGPDSTRIISTTGDNVVVWNALTGLNLYTYHSKYREIARLVAWSPNGAYIAQTATQISGKQSLNVTEVWTAPAGA